jgi:myosin heavy subunit
MFGNLSDPEVVESCKYLVVPQADRIKAQSQPFDGKKNFWCPDKADGYIACELQSEKGDQVTVKTSKGETLNLKKDDLQQMNPPKFEKCEDMADLTYLNDASILHNLRTRYMSWLIYTYSGLFCVAINPYKRLPVYTMKMVDLYRGKKKNEVPPHLYSIADTAYANMLRDRENQTMLIT